MFDIGWSEIALIGIVAVVVLGPKEMPTAMRYVARAVRGARKIVTEFQRQVDDVIHQEEVKEIQKALADNGLEDFRKQVERELQNTSQLLETDPAPPALPAPTVKDKA